MSGRFFVSVAQVSSDITAALEKQGNNTLVRVRVATGSDTARFPAGYDQWRHCIEAAVTAPPERGRANRELLELASAFFDLASDEIALAYGHTGREKGVLIGRPIDHVEQRLSHGL